MCVGVGGCAMLGVCMTVCVEEGGRAGGVVVVCVRVEH